MTTGEIIKEKRIALGLTQVDMANRLCVSKSFINKVENDKAQLPYKRIMQFAEVLCCRPAELIGDYEEHGGTLIELDSIAKGLSEASLGALVQYARYLSDREPK